MTQSSDPPIVGRVDPVPGGYPARGPQLDAERGLGAQREGPSTTDVAKDQAAEVANTARDAGKHVAGVAGEQVGQVASEATHQVKQLVAQTRGELTEQAASQQQRVAKGLRSLSKELSAMVHGSEQAGMATDLVQQASERTNAVASWLEQREPGHVVDEVTRFARRRPGAFLALAAGAGLLVGRLGRSLKAANDEGNDGAPQGSTNIPNTRRDDTGRQGYSAPAPLPPAPSYPPTQGRDPSGGYQPAPNQQPPGAPSRSSQEAGYPPPPSYPPPAAPTYPQGPSGRDLAP